MMQRASEASSTFVLRRVKYSTALPPGGVLRQAYPKTSELKAIKLKATMVAVRDILTILAVISYSITLEAIVQL
jgi:hypothetical protein